MSDRALIVIIGAYGILAVLLLSLNLASLWRWPIKAAAILLTTGVFVGTYAAFGDILGWPSAERLPERAAFLASRIVEPDKLSGEPGAIYVWLQDIDDKNLPVGRPRAYQLAFDRAVAGEVVKAQRLRLQGRNVVGKFEYAPDEKADAKGPPVPKMPGQEKVNLKQVEDRTGGAGGMFSLTQDLTATFQEMPPPVLPDKLPIEPDY